MNSLTSMGARRGLRRRWGRFVSDVRRDLPAPAEIAVSIASRADRFPYLTSTVKSIVCGSVRPQSVWVWVDADERQLVPSTILELADFGVRVCTSGERLGPYTKLIPTFRLMPDVAIVTADDDMCYHHTWLAELLSASTTYPDSIVGHRASRVGLDTSGAPTPYASWPVVQGGTRGMNVFLTGVGGILYPRGSVTPAWDDPELFGKLSPRNDDLWFFARSVVEGRWRVAIKSSRPDPIPWPGSQRRALWRRNVQGGENDLQTRALFEWFGLGRILEKA